MNLITRLKEPTPRFFRKIRNLGLAVTSVSATILAAPVALPAALVAAAGYLAVAGTVASAVSQAVTKPTQEQAWAQEFKPKKRK